MGWGTVNACQVVNENFEKRFEDFMEAFMERRVVPLLGAGVSCGSVKTAGELAQKLSEELKSPFDRDGAEKTFARVCEVLHWQHGEEKLCEFLEIEDWADVTPTRAHLYLALLALEGWISEVITTNYDCGIENAWRRVNAGRDDGLTTVATGRDLDRPHGMRPHLCLYKINGCAKRLKDAPTEEEKAERAREILLTDVQLHQFGERRWARDLFATLLRAHQIVLSGFGSDEPQIWHVVMDILAEFSGMKPANGGKRFLWAALHDGKIPFHVLQALVGENRVRGRSTPLDFGNVFSAADHSFFADGGGADRGDAGPPCATATTSSSEGKLEAGDFWRKVWLEALRRGLEKPEQPVGHAFFWWFRGHPYRARRLADVDARQCWQGVVAKAFEKKDWLGEPNDPSPLPPALTCVRDSTGVRYLSTVEEPDYWLKLLLLRAGFPEVACTAFQAQFEDHEPIPVIVLGRSEILASNSERESSGPALRRDPDDAAIVREIMEEEREARVVLSVSAPLLSILKGRWRPKTSVEELSRMVCFCVQAEALHSARQLEAQRRESRRQHPEGS